METLEWSEWGHTASFQILICIRIYFNFFLQNESFGEVWMKPYTQILYRISEPSEKDIAQVQRKGAWRRKWDTDKSLSEL